MQKNPRRITGKESKAVSGNWGHPTKFDKKHTKIPNPLIPEEIKHGSIKKKKKKRVPYVSSWEICPFCEEKLVELPKSKNTKWCSVFESYELKCRHCGARYGKLCPCCKQKTWYLNKIYKHQWMGCGFIGKKLKKRL